jgi:hypothetical protein
VKGSGRGAPGPVRGRKVTSRGTWILLMSSAGALALSQVGGLVSGNFRSTAFRVISCVIIAWFPVTILGYWWERRRNARSRDGETT